MEVKRSKLLHIVQHPSSVDPEMEAKRSWSIGLAHFFRAHSRCARIEGSEETEA